MSPLYRLGALVASLATAVALFPPSATAATPVQVVQSSEGLVASGYVFGLRFPDGTTREMKVTLVVPGGVVTTAGEVTAVDLSRPWALATQTITNDPAGGHARIGQEPCNTVANPGRFGIGALRGNRWDGTFVDVSCNDGSGFDFYRVRWPTGSFVLLRDPLNNLIMGGQLVRWRGPAVSGQILAWPQANQQTYFTVCGHRAEREVTCFGGEKAVGAVTPTNRGMVVQASGS